MVMLYPPVVEGTIPAFYGDTITVPFTMNRSVSPADFNHIYLKIKGVQTNQTLGVLEDIDISSDYTNATFSIEGLPLNIGQFYKIQLAYVITSDQEELDSVTTGYYSTVAIGKYIAEPEAEIVGLDVEDDNPFQDSFTAQFSCSETTEKLYSTQFILYDGLNVIEDSGVILHNVNNDTSSSTGVETYSFAKEPGQGELWSLACEFVSTNGYTEIIEYDISPRESFETELDVTLKRTLDIDNGIITLSLGGEETGLVSGDFVLLRTSDGHTWDRLNSFELGVDAGLDQWSFEDRTYEHGIVYTYAICEVIDDARSNKILSEEIKGDFEDIILYDGHKQLKVKYNASISSFKSMVGESISATIGSRTPFYYRNGIMDYKEFPLSGLISYWEDEKELFLEKPADFLVSVSYDTENIKFERDFREAAENWLKDGKIKLFRSPTEGNYLVVLTSVSLSPEEVLGRLLYNFSCEVIEMEDYNFKTLQQLGFIN